MAAAAAAAATATAFFSSYLLTQRDTSRVLFRENPGVTFACCV